MERKKKDSKNSFWELYRTFARIGFLMFGGGLTMLPVLKYEIVEKRSWATEEELLDCYAIGQCTPGAIAVNVATYIGYGRAGVMGGIVATLGIVSPSVFIILVIAALLGQFMEYEIIIHAMNGIKAVVCALLVRTVFTMGKATLRNLFSAGIFVFSILLALFTNVPGIAVIIGAGILGILYARGGNA